MKIQAKTDATNDVECGSCLDVPQSLSQRDNSTASVPRWTPLTKEQIADLHRRIGYNPRPKSAVQAERLAAIRRSQDEAVKNPESVAGKLARLRVKHRMEGGEVYFAQCGDYVKIGHTKLGAKWRINAFVPGNPYPIKLIYRVRGRQALEKDIHRALAHLRHHGEWFHLTDELREALKFALRPRSKQRMPTTT